MVNWKIDKKLLPVKGHYFLWNAGTGPVVPYLSVFGRQLGFSSVTIGIIYTIIPICGMLAKLIVGGIADRFQCQKKLFLAAILLTAAAFIATFYSPELPINKNVHFACDNGEAEFHTNNSTNLNDCIIDQITESNSMEQCTMECQMNPSSWKVICDDWNITKYCGSRETTFKFISQVPTNKAIKIDSTVYFKITQVEVDKEMYVPNCQSSAISTDCTADCSSYDINQLILQPALSDSEVYHSYQFWIFLTLMIISYIGQAISVSVGDAICFAMLGDKHNKYGNQRLFGAIGWGVFSPIIGVLIDYFSDGKTKKDYTVAFYASLVFLILNFIVSSKIQHKQKNMSVSIVRDIGKLIADVRIFVYLLWCIAVGLCTALIWSFIFWIIEDLAAEQGCSSQGWIKTLEGLIMAVECFGGDLPFFFLSGWILKKIGHINSMTLVLFVYGIRLTLYSVIENPWWFLPVEVTNGLTFGLFYATMASYASIVAPPGTEATMQGLVGAVFEGVGVSIGSAVAGVLYKKYGGPITFRIFGIGAFIVCIIHAGVQYLLRFKKDTEAVYVSPSEAMADYQDDDYQELTVIDS